MPQKANYESKKILIWGENGINSKLKHRKPQLDFIREIWWPIQEISRFELYPGDSQIIWESWHVCPCPLWVSLFQAPR